MADATTLPTVSPKQLGKQLRSVRRRKGLSLSEVARGAGLSRRELVAYERGKVEIPESDLWVIAGSCGVDVAELVPPTDPLALPSGPESIEDTISQLRRALPGDSLQRHLDTLYALRALPPGSVVQLQEGERAALAQALGGNPSAIERRLVETMRVSKDEAKRLRALVVPDSPRSSPLALDAPAPKPAPQPAPPVAAAVHATTAFDATAYDATRVVAPNGVAAPGVAPVHAPDLTTGPVDVFEELAKLPEPVALPDQHAAGHDMFAPPPEPVTVPAGAEAGVEAGASGPFATWSSMRSALPEPSAPVVVEPTNPTPGEPTFGAAYAPPIDVVGRVDTPSGFWNPLPVNGDGGFAPLDALVDTPVEAPVDAPLSGDPQDVVEPVDPVGTGTAPEEAPARGAGGWQAWWTPPPVTEATTGFEAADALAPPAFEGFTAGMPEAPEAPEAHEAYASVGPPSTPVQMIEFVDDYVADAPHAAPLDAVSFPGVPAVGVPTVDEPLVRPAFAGYTPASYEAPVDAPMTDAERYAAGVFEPAPTDPAAADTAMTDAAMTDPAMTDPAMTDAARAAAGMWPSWQPGEVDEAADAAEAGASDGWSPDTGAAPPEHPALLHDAGMETPWGHQPDTDASSTGFYVDWGSPDEASGAVTDTADDPWVAAALDTQVGAASTFAPVVGEPSDFASAPFESATVEPSFEPASQPVSEPAFADEAPGTSPPEASTTTSDEQVAVSPETEEAPAWPTDDEPTPISWRPLADTVLAAVAVEMSTRDADQTSAPAPAPDLVAPDPVEEFVTAGEQWELGNALPLVEVRGQGGLVMRRADERWALADVRSTMSFALEVDVDFRSGPGFGVLFRASTDDEGHMAGYSFDVDPIHEGGSYLVRQWQADRELWNPIAHVPAPDPSDMHGVLTLRIVVVDDSVTASVNGAVVLTVDSLEQACAERNREPATGDRVGIQAWSSSDLVIDALRVAER